MLWTDLCYKLYFWPFLNYLAGIKGICPFYPGFFPLITLTPGTILTTPSTVTTTTTTTVTTTTTTAGTTVPTFSPTPPTVLTLPPCPAQPLLCLNDGTPPIPYCPCIDPRQSGLVNAMGATTLTPSLALRAGAAISSDRLVFMPVNAQPNVAQNLQQQQPSGSSNFNFPLRSRNGVQPSATPGPVGSDTLIFSSLSGRRRRKRRKWNVYYMKELNLLMFLYFNYEWTII